MLTLIRFLLIFFTLGNAEDSGVFGDHFEHVYSQSAKDLSSFIGTHSAPKVNLRVDDIVEAFHSVTIKNRHFSVAGHDRETSVIIASSNSVQHLFRQTNSTLQLHNLWISLTDPSTILSFLDSSSLSVAQTTISTAGTNNLVAACPSTSYGLPSSVSITFSDVHVLTQSGVVPSFVGVSWHPDSNGGAGFDVSMNVLSQTLDSVKLIPQGGIFVSSPTLTERWSDLSTSVFSSGCRCTNISSVPTASPNMPHHSRTRYTQLISGMDMTQSEHGLYGLVSSDINSGGDFLFKNTSFSHCTTTETGKAFVQGDQSSYSSVTEFNTCTFTSMTSTTPGAAIHRQSADTLTLTTCTFTQCESTVAQFQHGGALCAYMCNTVQLTGTNTFDRCVCRGGAGGGFYVYKTATTLAVSGVTCKDCSNSDGTNDEGETYFGFGGGGILGMETKPEAAVQISNCKFIGCSSTSTGGLVVQIPWTDVSYCEFTECEGNGRADGGGLNILSVGTHSLTFSSFTNCSHLTGAGGGVSFPANSIATLETVSFLNCSADGYAGGCALGTRTQSNLTDCSFTSCSCRSGGGLYVSNGETTITLCNFTGCSSTRSSDTGNGGGAIHISQNSTTLSQVLFDGCTAIGVNGASISAIRCTLLLEDSNFTSCHSKKGTKYSYGAGVYAESTKDTVLRRCNFVACTAEGQGAGVNMGGTDVTIESCVFERCDGGGWGTAIRTNLMILVVKNCTIDQCTGKNQNACMVYLDTEAGEATITNSTIKDCSGEGQNGGGVFSKVAKLTLSTVVIEDTSLVKGSGIYAARGAAGLFESPSFSLSSCTFDRCTSESRAGGLYLKGADGTLTECAFDTCIATGGNGGAVEIEGISSVAFVSCVFKACSSGNGDGGAVWANVIDNTISFKEGTIKSCSASKSGGGIFVSLLSLNDGTVKLENVGFGEEGTELNSCAVSGTNIFVNTSTVPSILNSNTLVADYFTTPKNTETNVFDATELESYMFGTKQQNSTSLVYLANPYTGGPVFASAGKFDHELCGNSKLPCAVLDRAHNIAKESSNGYKDAEIIIQSDFDLTGSITSTQPIKWTSSSSQMHKIRTATCTIEIDSETFTAHALHFTPKTIQTSPTLFTISGTGSLVLSSSKLSSFTLDEPLIKHEGASVEITGTTIEHVTLSATAAIVTSQSLTITHSFFNTITSQHKGGSAISAHLGQNTTISVKDTGFVKCVANNVENWVLLTGLESRTSLESDNWAGTFNQTSEWSGVMVEENAEEGPYSLLYHFYPRPVGSFHVTKSNSSNFRLCGHSFLPCHSLPKSFDVTHEPLAEVREAELNELLSIGDRSLTIVGHNKRGVVQMTSKGCVLSSNEDDPGTLTFKELNIDLSSSQLTSDDSFFTFEDGSLSFFTIVISSSNTVTPTLLNLKGGDFVAESLKIRQVAFTQTPFSLHPDTSTEITSLNVDQCITSSFLSAENCSLTLVTCTFSLQQSVDQVNDADEMCAWSTGLLVFDHCTTTLSFPTFDSVAQGAIAMRGGTLHISNAYFTNCSQSTSSTISTRKHIACSDDGSITILPPWTSDDDSTDNHWISTDSCRVTKAGNPVLAPLFVPTIDVNKTKTTGGKKSLYNLTLIGTSLYPCDLSLCVWEDSEEKNAEPIVFNLPTSVFKNTTTIVTEIDISSGSFSSSTVLRGALQYDDGLVTDSFKLRASSSERFSQAFDKNKNWLIPVIIVSVVALLNLLIILILVRRHQKKKKQQNQSLSSQQELVMAVDVKDDDEVDVLQRMDNNTVHTNSGLFPAPSHSDKERKDHTAVHNQEDNDDAKEIPEPSEPIEVVQAYNIDENFSVSFVSTNQSLFHRIHHSDDPHPLNSGAILLSVIKGIKYLQSQKQDNLVVSLLTPHHFFLDSSGKVSLGASDHLRNPGQAPLLNTTLPSEANEHDNNHFFRESNIGSVNDNTVSSNTLKQSTNAQPVKSTEGQRWMAPEVAGRKTALDVGRAAVFSLGLVLWEIETGSVPFGEVDAVNAQRQLGAGSPLNMDRISSDSIKSIIASCLEVDPHARLCLDELEDSLKALSTENGPHSKPHLDGHPDCVQG
ncbi:hypothetical protein BLNAU_23862 [Blattamonas nauphoetae]|uniref:Protein kinase domain-containing protein n=1 Tax=Blattamonas nauphoetae TaxID=2049346 RepID=A0ABQ9WP17_9EUKA|nr:hypothetical protein BLNAU_23862 [Blattamonas nauphoetae]